MFKLFFYTILSVFIISCGVNDNPGTSVDDNKLEEVNTFSLPVKSSSNLNKQDKTIGLFQGYLKREYVYNFKLETQIPGEEFYLYEGELPKGLELDEATGIVSGIPEETGDFKIKIAVKDKENADLVIIPATISIADTINFYKDVRSFIDLSKTVDADNNSKSNIIHNNGIINTMNFNFYGQPITEIKVCENGYLKLGANSGDCSVVSDQNAKNLILPFATPDFSYGSDSYIRYQVRGTEPRRMLIVQFENLHRIADPTASQNFEVILYEDTSRITFLYGLSYSGIDATQKHLGTNAVIGVVSSDGHGKAVAPEAEGQASKPQIFNGTVITFTYENDNYVKETDSNIVTDFLDISRYRIDTKECSADSSCISNNCSNGDYCSAQLLTSLLMYDRSTKVKLPFNFNFYGNSFNEVKVHENGYLFFGAENFSFNPVVPTSATAVPVSSMNLENVIAGMYSNIDLKSARGGNILYNIVGESPKRKAVFLYDKVRIKDIQTDEIHICTFEMVLHETSNVIEFLYGTNNKSDFCNGKVSTVGLRKDNTTNVSIISKNMLLKQGKSITFVPNDSTANSYTWVGLDNETKNSVSTNGSNSSFTEVGNQWQAISDKALELTGYTKSIVSDRWIDSSGADSFKSSVSNYDEGYISLSYTDPDTSQPITFNTYNQPRSIFYLQLNGAMTFNAEDISPNEPVAIDYNANIGFPDIGIFTYWNDLFLVKSRSELRYEVYTRGTDPEYILMIEWKDLARIYENNGTRYYGGHYTFQLQLHQSGQMYLCYQEMDDSWSSRNTSYLSGIRNNKTDYIQNSDSLKNLATTGNCISYTPILAQTDIPATRANEATDNNLGAGEEKVDIGFTYNFQGTDFTDITISSNGIAIFGDATANNISGANLKLSSINSYDNSLPLFWDNLKPSLNAAPNSGNGIFYTTIGTAPNRSFILSYNNVPHEDNSNSRINAQVVLQEGVANILYCYGNLSPSYGPGTSATVGVRKNSSEYTQLLYNGSPLTLSSNDCYIWNPASPGFIEARNIYTKESNSDFIDLPVEDSSLTGVYLDPLYLDPDDGLNKAYKIYDLTAQNYNFEFKGKEYSQLFVDANGGVSFGNDSAAAIVTSPMWGDIFYQEDLENKAYDSLNSPYKALEDNYMWIANSGDTDGLGNGSLAKINTHSGIKIGEYTVGKSPSRTAVGFDGSVWVGNRDSYNVTKLERDGTFICTINLADKCSPRGLALDKDENLWVGCGAWKGVAPDGWVYKIKDTHSQSGTRCEIIDIRENDDNSSDLSYKKHENYGHYGFALDKNGILWSSPGTHDDTHNYFIRINTNKAPDDTGFYNKFRGFSNNPNKVAQTWVSRANIASGKDGFPYKFYGIAIDLNGDLWLGNWGNTSKSIALTKAHYDETSNTLIFETFPSYQNKTVGYARGVAIDINGNIYVAYSGVSDRSWGWSSTHSDWRWIYFVNGDGDASAVGKFDSNGDALALFHLNNNGANDCKTPAGIGVDGDGQIWANCMNGYSEEIDPDTGTELTSLATGESPYCYSDNTGFNLRNIVSDIKPAKYYANVVEKVLYDDDNNATCSRVLVVQWRDVRLKSSDYGYTESTFEMIFDNGRRYNTTPNGLNCDLSTVIATAEITIKYLYGAMQGNKPSQKTGGDSTIVMKSLYSNYNHVFGDNDAGTVNSGSKLVITSKK